MAIQLPNGANVAIASTYATAATTSAITNATEAVATLSASHGIIVGDIFEVTSGWGELDGRVVRAKTVSTNDVTLEDINTSSTTRFPAGSGTGSVREISAWTALSQILSFTTTGGEQQYYPYQYLDSLSQRQIPTVRAAQSIEMTLADDQTLPWYAAVVSAAESQAKTAMRVTLPNGAKLYYNGIWSINKTPTLNVNEGMSLAVSFSMSAELTRYAS